MEEQDKVTTPKSNTPPYISWKTFIGFIRSFEQGLPPRIDKSAMNRLSGGNQGQVTNTLTYLKLVKTDGKPEPLLERIVDSLKPDKQADYQELLKTMLKNAYVFLFDGTGDFDLERSTSAQFDEKFRGQGVTGETVQKCETFFIFAAKEAGIKISRFILDTKRKGPKQPSTGAATKQKGTKQEIKPKEETPPPYSSPKQDLPIWYSTFKAAFDKLPAFGEAHWTSAEREKWLTSITALVDLYVEVNNGKKNNKGGD
jgi:hypothetical protein